MSRIIVLGAGMVGIAMAIDLSKKHHVTLTDLSISRLNHVSEKYKALSTLQVDVSDTTKLQAILVVNLLISAVLMLLFIICNKGSNWLNRIYSLISILTALCQCRIMALKAMAIVNILILS